MLRQAKRSLPFILLAAIALFYTNEICRSSASPAHYVRKATVLAAPGCENCLLDLIIRCAHWGVKHPQIISASILFLSFLVAIGALVSNRRTQQQLKAQDSWNTFLQKAIEYPLLAYPKGHNQRFNYNNKTVLNAYDEPDKFEFERYEWFISLLLKTAREILEHFSNDVYWKGTIRRNFRYHKAYWKHRRGQRLPDDFIDLSGLGVTRLIDEIVAEPDSEVGA
jgi:hypothetical protein